MRRLHPHLRTAATLVSLVFCAAPLLGDLHFATTHHTWCARHQKLEDLEGPAPKAPARRANGVYGDAAGPGEHTVACPMATAVRVTRTRAVRASAPALLGPTGQFAHGTVVATRSVLERAPKHGPPAI